MGDANLQETASCRKIGLILKLMKKLDTQCVKIELDSY